MTLIGRIGNQVAILVAKRQLTLEVSTSPQALFKHKHVLVATIHPFEQNCLPSNSIPKLYKSTKATKGNLDENFTPRRYTPEDD